MSVTGVAYFISQIVFIPPFLITTKNAFKTDMTWKTAIRYLLLCPSFVYFYFIIGFGLIAALGNSAAVQTLAPYSDIFALLLSYVFAFFYAKTGPKNKRRPMYFVYLCYYMVNMIFSLTYNTPLLAVIFSIVIPVLTALGMHYHFTKPIAALSKESDTFHMSLVIMPVIGEVMLSLRFLLQLFIHVNSALEQYDGVITIYCTIFGYMIIAYIFLTAEMSLKDLRQLQTISQQNKSLTETNARINKLTFDMLRALVGTIEAKDNYTNGHSNRVAYYSKMLALRQGRSAEEVHQIYMVALLHDIGKIAIPDEIINKPGKLTREEFETIKLHPVKGAEILKDITEFPDLYLGALYHHERWDGKGYPNGLAGEDIPDVARLISVADSYDAMTSKRSYRLALPQEVVIAEIEKGSGTQFCPEYAALMLEIIREDTDYLLKQD